MGLKTNRLSLSELIEIISKKLTRQTLEKSIELATENGLSKMTVEEIDEEVKASRNAKNEKFYFKGDLLETNFNFFLAMSVKDSFKR